MRKYNHRRLLQKLHTPKWKKRVVKTSTRTYSPFAEELRKQRISGGWSQLEFGVLIGVSNTLVSHWELGKVIPDEGQIQKILNVFSTASSKVAPGNAASDSSVNNNIRPFQMRTVKTMWDM